MKAKSRRRLLISSIAMLLVAMLALGTATFAWFTSSTQATANGINVSTIKASELVISKADLAWNTTLNYNHTSTSYTPVSTVNGTGWYEANAELKTNFAKKSTDTFSDTSSSLTNKVYTEALNIGNKGEAAVENVKIEITGLTGSYSRLAIFEVTANNGTTHKTAGETFAQCIYDSEGDTYNAASGTAANATTSVTATAPDSGKITIDVADLAGKTDSSPEIGNTKIGGIAYYKFYVWFEGQDEDCVDANAGTPFGNLTFTVSGDTVTA